MLLLIASNGTALTVNRNFRQLWSRGNPGKGEVKLGKYTIDARFVGTHVRHLEHGASKNPFPRGTAPVSHPGYLSLLRTGFPTYSFLN